MGCMILVSAGILHFPGKRAPHGMHSGDMTSCRLPEGKAFTVWLPGSAGGLRDRMNRTY